MSRGHGVGAVPPAAGSRLAARPSASIWPRRMAGAVVDEPMRVFDAEVCIDVREKALIRVFDERGAKGHVVRALPAGDVMCTYAGGHGWLAERKSARDFVSSICDGRYAEQRGRLFETSGFRVVFVVEGDLRGPGGDARDLKWHQNMLSAIVGLNSGDRAQVYRTWDVKETFDLIGVLVRKFEAPPRTQVPSGLTTPASKRQREASPGTALVRMLCCVPSVSENVARKLKAEFGSLPALQRALSDEVPFRKIELGNGKFIGKDRLRHLRRHLLEPPAAQSEVAKHVSRTPVACERVPRPHPEMRGVVAGGSISGVLPPRAPSEPWRTACFSTVSIVTGPSRRSKRTTPTAHGC